MTVGGVNALSCASARKSGGHFHFSLTYLFDLLTYLTICPPIAQMVTMVTICHPFSSSPPPPPPPVPPPFPLFPFPFLPSVARDAMPGECHMVMPSNDAIWRPIPPTQRCNWLSEKLTKCGLAGLNISRSS